MIIIVVIIPIEVCSDGDTRLMNGTVNTPSSGRVEVCFNNSYGSVCGVRWDEADASVVCRQLNLQTSSRRFMEIFCTVDSIMML